MNRDESDFHNQIALAFKTHSRQVLGVSHSFCWEILILPKTRCRKHFRRQRKAGKEKAFPMTPYPG